MKVLIVLAALVAVATCWSIPSEDEIAKHWQKFKAEHGKNYANKVEEAHRRKIFKENVIMIAKHNARFAAGKVTYKVAINKFADMLTHEVFERHSGYRPPVSEPVREVHDVNEPESEVSWSPWAKTVDWRTKGYVTDVKQQGTKCASDWAFAVTGALEAAFRKKHRKLVALSAQNLVDCFSHTSNNTGCDGGSTDEGYAYVKDNGIDTEESYPYQAKDGTCAYSKENSVGTLSSVVNIKKYSEMQLKDAVRKVGPVSVNVDSYRTGFQFYDGGIFYDVDCSTEPNYSALVVGYGSQGENSHYWLVKTSLGTDWGDKGYIKMARNRDNNCAIATAASYPKV